MERVVGLSGKERERLVELQQVKEGKQTLVEAKERGALSLRLILHGRKVCTARKARCDECVLADMCPSAFKV